MALHMVTMAHTVTDPGAGALPSSATLLQLIWLASPALPVGGFSYSEVLESAVETGRIDNEERAAGWLSDQLQLVLARAELPLVAAACRAWQQDDGPEIEALNAWSTSVRESAELRAQSEQMGRSLLAWLRNAAGADGDARIDRLAELQPAPTWPVAFALAAVRSGATSQQTLLAFAFGWAENLVQAALKAVPLGQSAGQRILARLAAEIPAAVEQALHQPAGERQAFAPMHAILSAQHETQYSRLFRS